MTAYYGMTMLVASPLQKRVAGHVAKLSRGILPIAFGLCAHAGCSHRNNMDSTLGARLTEDPGTIDLVPGNVWDARCLIHRPCETIKPLHPCPGDIKASVDPIPVKFPEDEGNEVMLTVAGRLFQDQEIESTLVACSSGTAEQLCCNRTSLEVHLAGEHGIVLRLPKLGCFGDESRLCCNIIVTGQRVVATGIATLQREDSGPRALFKDSIGLCAL